MNDNLILILCAGRASKWKGLVPKQCALVEGQPLIARTAMQIHTVWSDGVTVGIVTHDGLMWEHVYQYSATLSHGDLFSPRYVIPAYDKYVCGTLLSTMHLWPGYDRVTVLLGDVVYSSELLIAIEKDPIPERIRFYGSEHERWAITWKQSFNETMILTLIHSVHATAIGYALDKLATPFRMIADHPLRQPYGSDASPYCPELYTLWDHDYVDDFDTVEEYDKWLKQNSWAQ